MSSPFGQVEADTASFEKRFKCMIMLGPLSWSENVVPHFMTFISERHYFKYRSFLFFVLSDSGVCFR